MTERPSLAPDNTVYLRIGPWRKQSHNFSTGQPEAGVSVYDLDAKGNPTINELDASDIEFAWLDLRDRMRSDEPKYLVTGRIVGMGGDGEPLLDDVRLVGHWTPGGQERRKGSLMHKHPAHPRLHPITRSHRSS